MRAISLLLIALLALLALPRPAEAARGFRSLLHASCSPPRADGVINRCVSPIR